MVFRSHKEIMSNLTRGLMTFRVGGKGGYFGPATAGIGLAPFNFYV